MKKRVLVCSVSCWNQKTGADTFSALMDGYGADCVANLYIHSGTPDSPVCCNYFQISESAIIKSIFNKEVKTGRKVTVNHVKNNNSGGEMEAINYFYKNNVNKRNYLLLYLREFLWKIGKWKSKELDDFLEEFQPDVVFFAMVGYIHLNRICRYILEKTGAKGVAYFWDDTFTYRQSNFIGHQIYRFFQRRELKRCVKLCSDFFAIAPKTKKEADDFFGIDCQLLTKPIDFDNFMFEKNKPCVPLKMLYTGKLIIGRYDTIKLVGEALDSVNKDEVKIELDVYTTTFLDEKSICKLSKHVHLLDPIPQSQIAEVQRNSDILLFAEAIGGKNSKIARLSFSTKLTDYFRSGKCILAVGAPQSAPMEYLKNEDAAFIASTKNEIVDALTKIIENKELLDIYAEKAYSCGKRNHNKKQIQNKLFDVFNR